MSHFGTFPEKTSRDLFAEAYQSMLASIDHNFDPREIQAVYTANFSAELLEHQGQIAPLLTDWIGLTPRPATRIEAACASGGVALRQGVLAIASGLLDVVLVGGVEKMSARTLPEVTDILSTAADRIHEVSAGFTFPGFYALMAGAYENDYDADLRMLRDIAVKNHANGALNENAQFQTTIPDWIEKIRSRNIAKSLPGSDWESLADFFEDDNVNPWIAFPLRLFDCAPITDGAAAVLLVSENRAKSFTDTPLAIIGSGQASDGPIHTRSSLVSLQAAVQAARQAYAMAEVTPADIKMAEVHDCFTIAEAIAVEDLGFFPPGRGIRAAREGSTGRSGALPINPSGGLKAKEHPVGATGIAQVVEVWKQARREAGQRQVANDVDLALTHNVGGTGQTCAVHIFERG
jgi:acetyl-CoA acetyltransferase